MQVARVLEQIDSEARGLVPVRVVLTVLASPLFVVGLAVGLVARFAWLVVSWLWAAGVVGFRVGRGGR